jgi:hypothetical protein
MQREGYLCQHRLARGGWRDSVLCVILSHERQGRPDVSVVASPLRSGCQIGLVLPGCHPGES